jgi:hypothetical protein
MRSVPSTHGESMHLPPSRTALALLAAATGIAFVAPAQAQQAERTDFRTARYFTVGYVGNAPDALIGGGATLLNPKGIGFFVNVKISGDSPGGRSNFLPDVTVEQARNQYGDLPYKDESDWFVVSGGLTRVLSPDLAVYAGAGLARREFYREFEDPDGIRGEYGYYWVEDTEHSGDFVNALAGLFFRAGRRFIVQFGVESEPRGMTIGIHYGLPRR